MRSIIFILFIYLLLIPSLTEAQNGNCNLMFSGRVTDVDHEEPLSFATIYLVELQTGAVCDENAKFEINDLCAGSYTLYISHLGCATDTVIIDLQKSMFQEFFLNHQDSVLETIQIHVASETYRGTLTTDYIEGKALEATAGKSLGNALKDMNGLNTIQTGNSISKPVIHGLHSNRILIMNNGVRQEGQQWGNEHGPEIDPFIADNITVIKGAAGVKYGSDAMGGVILVSAAPLPDTGSTSGAIQLVGFSNTKGGAASAYVQSVYKPFSWRLQGTLKAEGTAATPNYLLANTAYREANYSATVNYRKNDFETEVYYSYFNNKIGIFSGSHIGNLTDLENAFLSDTPYVAGTFTYAIGRPYQVIQHHLLKSVTHYHNDKIGNLYLTAAWQNNIRYEYDTHVPLDDSIAALNLPSLYFEIGTLSTDLEWKHHKKNNFTGSVGISGMNQQNITRYSTFIPNFKNYTGGIYALESYQFIKWTVEAGLRYDYKWMKAFYYEDGILLTPENQFSAISWNLGTTYYDRKHTTVNFNFSSAWRAPAMNELYSDGLHHGAAALEYGDPDLLLERSYQLTGSVEYETELTYFEVGAYNNYMHQFIYLQPVLPPALTIRGAFPVFEYRQTNANIYGIDATIHQHITEPFMLEAKFSMLRARDVKNDVWVVMMPADKITGKVHYVFPDWGKFKDLDAGISVVHVFKQNRTYADADYLPAPEAYTLTALSVGSDIILKNNIVSWSVEAENVFNVAYRDYLNRFRYFADDLGRNITLRIKIPFTI
jgi:iron complex outermembrane recepter protein